MKIRLLNDHTALSINDGLDTLHIDPPCAGTLTVERKRYCIEEGKEIQTPRLPHVIGRVGMTFTDAKTGVKYTVINPHVKEGAPYTAVDFSSEFFATRIREDEQEREIERLTGELLDLRAQIEPDSLGFLNIGGKENESI